MDTIAIRENSIRINNQKINGVQTIKIKSTAEKGYAEVYIKLLAKLVWYKIWNNLIKKGGEERCR